MSASALSIFIFGIYIVTVGIGFFLIPNKILPLLKFEKSNESWIRVLGFVVVVLGYYYITAAQHELTPFFWATVYGRFAVLVGFTALVLTKKAKPMLILFGVIDAIGAIWTLTTLT